ncbi:hypothetical protein B7463_g11209, partial [Scytalidium lignicola]
MYRTSSATRQISTILRSSRSFSSTSAKPAKIPFNVSSTGSGVSQSIAVAGSPHTINVDAYPSFGGKDAAPSPLAYNLSSLSSCTQVTGSLVAKELGIKLGEWKVDVKGILDTAVLVEGKEGNANWDSIDLKFRVQTDAKDDLFAKFGSETERRCPITQLFKRSGAQVKSEWVNERA